MKKLILIFIFSFILNQVFMVRNASAQIVVTDPISIGVQAVIKDITAANTEIQAAESKIMVELSALKYVRQGQQLMAQIQNLQQESSSLIGAVNNLESTTMMPANELEGLKNSLTSEEASMTNIINMENGNPLMQGFMKNYQGEYGAQSLNLPTYSGQTAALQNQYQTANTQAMQTAGYAQSVLNNAATNQHLISQLGANVAAAHGSVSATQATGQAVVALTEEVNQTNKLLAEQAKLQAVQAGQAESAGQAATAPATPVAAIVPINNNSAWRSPFGSYPNVTNFNP